jgi:TRAP-type C4-dicarboxylate transport system permease small subunit
MIRKCPHGVSFKWIDKHFEEVCLAILLFAMVILSGLQVFMRYVTNTSLAWSEELTRYGFVWSGFLCLGYCIRRRSDLRIDVFLSILPNKAKIIFEIILDAVSVTVFCAFAYTSVIIIQKTIDLKQVSAALNIPMQYIYMAPFVGFSVSIVRIFQRIFMRILEFSGKNEFKKIEDIGTGKMEE